ncbi:MAG: hypothetical protein WA208_00610 [Thermoanaerobaculia bacterium]
MISRRLILLLLVVSACKPGSQQAPAAGNTAEPKIRATVVSIRTTQRPSNAVHAHQIVIANGKARNTGERDIWRLFDTEKKTVTTVDDVTGTYSTEAAEVLLRRQRAVLRERPPSKVARLEYRLTDETREMFGATARQAVATAGAYRRELWIADHPAIPQELFSMMQASTPPSSPLVSAGAELELALLDLDGFPMIDRYELPFGQSGRFAADHLVVGVAERDVPQSVLMIPPSYRDVTPRPPPPDRSRKRK